MPRRPKTCHPWCVIVELLQATAADCCRTTDSTPAHSDSESPPRQPSVPAVRQITTNGNRCDRAGADFSETPNDAKLFL